jgi:SAM-dependent methyltransferase
MLPSMPVMSVSTGTRAALIKLGRRWLGTRQLNQLVRFEPVLNQIEQLQSGHMEWTLLDVGGGSAGITTMLPAHWQTTVLDASFEDYAPGSRSATLAPNQLLGDARALPFGDGCFDVVVAVDLLEHIAAADRARAIAEICRVSRRLAVIACPAGGEALAADRRLAEWFEAKSYELPGWLVEHLDNGLPEADEIVAAASPYGITTLLGNESVSAHYRLVTAEHRLLPAVPLRIACRPLEALMRSRRRRARRISERVLAAARGADRPPVYRTVVVIDRDAPESLRTRNSTE